MAAAHELLWRRIAAHSFEHPGQGLDFLRRLAREANWSAAFSRGAIEEYRRFAYLCVTEPQPMTPSEEVDAVWHLHLTYTRDYWDVWCRDVLGTHLHHDPTQGGPDEQARYRHQYGATLAAYERIFGLPSQTYWPATHARFRNALRFRTVDTNRALILPVPALVARTRG